MTTLKPRAPYSAEELAKLYPKELELQQVQILLRHGERTPVTARFTNTGLTPYWPYCKAATALKAAVLNAQDDLSYLGWKRRLEKFGPNDTPELSTGPGGEVDAICQPGELTNEGRNTTLALGSRIRNLYVIQLGFLPESLDATSVATVNLRSTPIVRALESVQQVFNGLYPATNRAAQLPLPVVVSRPMQEETLFPNEGGCKRFRELAHAFAERAASLYNDGPELAYINKKIGKWMPKESPHVKVDSHPRLSGVMDTLNATLAHGKITRLPNEFYDERVRAGVDRICVEEWFAGYTESNEYRKLGIGAAVGDLTQRMVEEAFGESLGSNTKTEGPFKMSLAGCHDTTIAATLAALGAFDIEKDKWPRYTSSIAFELFKSKDGDVSTPTGSSGAIWPSREKTWWYSLFSRGSSSHATPSARTPLYELSDSERSMLDHYYVRVRYNDEPVQIPFCLAPGRHLSSDSTFCNLAAFKEAADSFTPRNWKAACTSNLGQPAMKADMERPPGL